MERWSAAARHRYRGTGRAFADASLCDGRSRHPPGKGDGGRHAQMRQSPLSAARRRVGFTTSRTDSHKTPDGELGLRAMRTTWNCSVSALR